MQIHYSSSEFNFCKDDKIIELNKTNNIIFVYNHKLYYSINNCCNYNK